MTQLEVVGGGDENSSASLQLTANSHNNIEGVYHHEAEGRIFSMPLLLLLILTSFIIWAAVFDIDASVRATGSIIPIGRTQIIQAADGGVLSDLLVREGTSVVAGQSIARLERGRVNATVDENRSKVASLSIALIRAHAEAAEQEPKFGEEYDEYLDFVNIQSSLYAQRNQSLQDDLDTLGLSLGMARDELQMNENLLASGDASKLEVMRAQRGVRELEGEITAARNKYLQTAYEEASKLEADLGVARYKLSERKSVLEHTDIKAPVTGVVKYLKMNTIGGVLRPGDELMQISPTEGEMVVEARVKPMDIGPLTVGLPVSIKVDAFDYSVYGSLEGTLSYISSDTLTEQMDGQPVTYYQVRVTIDQTSKKSSPKLANVSLKPGMTVTVDIKTSKRSVLNYLAKPITRAFGGALNER